MEPTPVDAPMADEPAVTDVPMPDAPPTTDAPIAEAPAPAEEQSIDWIMSGHALLGTRVARPFGKRNALGSIVKWVDADDIEGDPALFHMRHDDGDGEDLEEHEVAEAAALYRTCPEAAKFEEKKAAKAKERAEKEASKAKERAEKEAAKAKEREEKEAA